MKSFLAKEIPVARDAVTQIGVVEHGSNCTRSSRCFYCFSLPEGVRLGCLILSAGNNKEGIRAFIILHLEEAFRPQHAIFPVAAKQFDKLWGSREMVGEKICLYAVEHEQGSPWVGKAILLPRSHEASGPK